MEFRPCIDIHNGKVKQIVGSSLKDQGDQAKENFVAEYDSAYYAGLYQENQLKGGHIILLNGKDSPYYEDAKRLIRLLEIFLPVPSENVPNDSILREFIGGSYFK